MKQGANLKRISLIIAAILMAALSLPLSSGAQVSECEWIPFSHGYEVCARAVAEPTPTPDPTPIPTPDPTPIPTPDPTPIPSGNFFESFDDNEGLDRFRTGAFLRDNSVVAEESWTGDHDLNCGDPTTQRVINRPPSLIPDGDYFELQDRDPSGLLYTCKNHLMTSMGDTSGYSVVYFSPDQTFDTVSSVCWSVNMTDLGARQWIKVAVLTLDAPDIMSSVAINPVGHPMRALEGPDRAVVSWSGADGLNKMRIGNVQSNRPATLTKPDGEVIPGPNAGSDKPTRFDACFSDDQNGTLTFTLAGNTLEVPGSFPEGPLKVVFQDHNYTPNKGCDNDVCIGNTWHWDNIAVNT